MKKLLLLLAVAMAFTLTAAAQDMGSSQTMPQSTTKTTKSKKAKSDSAGAAKEASLQGCLAAGTEPNTWKLTKGKKAYTVSGTDLSQHVGHEVKLTGDWETKGKSFKASNVEHISDTCTATAAASGKTKKEKKGAATPPGF